jgi:hypothetical protein
MLLHMNQNIQELNIIYIYIHLQYFSMAAKYLKIIGILAGTEIVAQRNCFQITLSLSGII